MNILFYLFDITYKLKDGKAVIYLFGKTPEGKQICIVDSSFEPYFYAEPKETDKIPELIQELANLRIQQDNESVFVTKVEEVERTFLPRSIKLLKLYANVPKSVPLLKKALETHPGIKNCYEYDILFTHRYLIDRRIIPFTLLEAIVPEKGEAEKQTAKEAMKVPVYEAIAMSQAEETCDSFRILSFDIETYNPEGKTAVPEKNPLLMLALYAPDFKKVLTWKRFSTSDDDIEFLESEEALIRRFKELVESYKPDILAGYFSDGFDFPYLSIRAKHHGVSLGIGLDHTPILVSSANYTTSKITGIVHFDVFKFIRNTVGRGLDTDTLTLNDVAQELLGEQKKEVDLNALVHTWDKAPEQLGQYCAYNLHDAYITHELAQKLLPQLVEFVKLVGLPPFEINRMSFSKLVENYILRQAAAKNILAPNHPDHHEARKRIMQTYKGAFVHEPKPGLYKNVVVFDFRSLYPSIIISFNISPYSLSCACCKEKGKVPGQEYWFCREHDGFLPSLLEELILRRTRVKEMLKSNKDNPLLKARSEALKLLANSFYGYLGFAPARWYSIESARSITAYGRHYIQKLIQEAAEKDFEVLYGDTDSVMIHLKGNQAREEAIAFQQEVNKKLPGYMELEYEGFYPTGLFVTLKHSAGGAKKKYALCGEDGRMKIKGFETVRRNYSLIAKHVQETVLNIVLREEAPEKAFAYVKQVIADLRERKIPKEQVIIFTQVQKALDSYENVGPHVAVARRMKEKGMHVGPGSIIGFIVTKGNGIIRDRAKLPEEVEGNDYDPDYYINHQIVPGVANIFSVLGFKEEELLKSTEQKGLGKWV